MRIFALTPYRHAGQIETVQYVQSQIQTMADLPEQSHAMVGHFRKATNRRLAVLQDEARRTRGQCALSDNGGPMESTKTSDEGRIFGWSKWGQDGSESGVVLVVLHLGSELLKGLQLLFLGLPWQKQYHLQAILPGAAILSVTCVTLGVAINYIVEVSDNVVALVQDVFILLFVLEMDEKCLSIVEYYDPIWTRTLLDGIAGKCERCHTPLHDSQLGQDGHIQLPCLSDSHQTCAHTISQPSNHPKKAHLAKAARRLLCMYKGRLG